MPLLAVWYAAAVLCLEPNKNRTIELKQAHCSTQGVSYKAIHSISYTFGTPYHVVKCMTETPSGPSGEPRMIIVMVFVAAEWNWKSRKGKGGTLTV